MSNACLEVPLLLWHKEKNTKTMVVLWSRHPSGLCERKYGDICGDVILLITSPLVPEAVCGTPDQRGP